MKKVENVEVFDKVKWHTERGMDFEEAKKHIFAVMIFLKEKKLLSEEGVDILESEGIDYDFSLNSDLLTLNGESFLIKNYKSYLKCSQKKGIPDAIIELNQKYLLSLIKVPKDKGFLYDSVDAHWPDCKKDGYKNYGDVVHYFNYLLEWLDISNLLNDNAKGYLEIRPVHKNFELRSWMLKDIANKAIPPVYDKWLRQIKYEEKNINMKILEDAINKEMLKK